MSDVNVNFPPSASPVRGVSAGEVDSVVMQVKADLEGQISGVTGQITGSKSKVDALWLDVKRDFGAKGDWNGTTGTDDSDAIQAAFDAIRHEGGNKIKLFFPTANYRITKPIIGHRVKIFAENNTVIIHDGPNAYFDFKPINPVAVNEFYELFIEGLAFRGKNGAKTGIKLTRASQFYFKETYMYDFVDQACHLIDCTIGNFVRPTASNNGVGFLLDGVAGVSWMHANVYMNTRADFEFKKSNGGIKLLDVWTEDSLSTILLDATQGTCSVDGLIMTDSIFGRNDLPGGPVFKVNGKSAVNSVRMNNVVFENNRVNFYLPNLNVADIDLTGSHAGSLIQLQLKKNFLYNEDTPDEYAIKAVGNTVDQVRVVYEDNATSGAVNILNGIGRVMGIDRSGAALTHYNKVRGELILEQPTNSTNMNGALSWDNTNKLPRFSDGVGYKSIQGISSGSTANRPVNPPAGYLYFDTTINRLMSWNGTFWRNPNGGNDYKFNTATIATGTNSVVVTHGLSLTPTNIKITPYGDVGNVWVSNITSTQFTINCKTAPAGNTVVAYDVQA